MKEVIAKLKFKSAGVVLNAPKDIGAQFKAAGFKTSLGKSRKNANTLVFINNNHEFIRFLQEDLSSVEPDSVLWFAYPKGTSRIKTDINRDTLRATGEEFGITTVAAISIDDTWSGLRFRPIDRVGK